MAILGVGFQSCHHGHCRHYNHHCHHQLIIVCQPCAECGGKPAGRVRRRAGGRGQEDLPAFIPGGSEETKPVKHNGLLGSVQTPDSLEDSQGLGTPGLPFVCMGTQGPKNPWTPDRLHPGLLSKGGVYFRDPLKRPPRLPVFLVVFNTFHSNSQFKRLPRAWNWQKLDKKIGARKNPNSFAGKLETKNSDVTTQCPNGCESKFPPNKYFDCYGCVFRFRATTSNWPPWLCVQSNCYLCTTVSDQNSSKEIRVCKSVDTKTYPDLILKIHKSFAQWNHFCVD